MTAGIVLVLALLVQFCEGFGFEEKTQDDTLVDAFRNPLPHIDLSQTSFQERCPMIDWNRFLSSWPHPEDVRPSFHLSPHDFTPALEKIDDLLPLMNDRRALAIFYTYSITKGVLKHMGRCPTVLYDKLTITAMQSGLNKLLEKEEDGILKTLITFLSQIKTNNSQWNHRTFAQKFAKHMHSMIFRDTIYYVTEWSIREVRDFSTTLFNNLLEAMGTSTVPTVVTLFEVLERTLTKYNLNCPSVGEVLDYHSELAENLISSFRSDESQRICNELKFHLSRYWSVKKYPEFLQLSSICRAIGSNINGVIDQVRRYEEFVNSQDWANVESLLSNFLDHNQVSILQEVLDYFEEEQDTWVDPIISVSEGFNIDIPIESLLTAII